MTEERVIPARWIRAAAWAAPIVALLGILYGPMLAALMRQWRDDPNYSHGFLIPLLAAYFIWERRAAIGRIRPAPQWPGIVVMAAGLCLLALGQLGADLFAQRVSLVVVIVGLTWLVLGKAMLGALRFPVAFLLFMVPLPAIVLNAVAFPLQGFAAQAATAALNTLSIPVLREGNVITLARTTLEVAEACSGIRSLMSLLTLATVYAYFTEPVLWRRWVLVAAAVPVAIVANAFRVAGTGILAHYVGEQAAQGFYHDFSGWLVFVVAFALLLAIAALLRRIGGARLVERTPYAVSGS